MEPTLVGLTYGRYVCNIPIGIIVERFFDVRYWMDKKGKKRSIINFILLLPFYSFYLQYIIRKFRGTSAFPLPSKSG